MMQDHKDHRELMEQHLESNLYFTVKASPNFKQTDTFSHLKCPKMK